MIESFDEIVAEQRERIAAEQQAAEEAAHEADRQRAERAELQIRLTQLAATTMSETQLVASALNDHPLARSDMLRTGDKDRLRSIVPPDEYHYAHGMGGGQRTGRKSDARIRSEKNRYLKRVERCMDGYVSPAWDMRATRTYDCGEGEDSYTVTYSLFLGQHGEIYRQTGSKEFKLGPCGIVGVERLNLEGEPRQEEAYETIRSGLGYLVAKYSLDLG